MKIKLNPLDILFSKYIRLRAGGKCEYCGEVKALQCSHFHGRRKQSTRYDPDNCTGLCFSCHQHLGENPYEHNEFFKKRLGSGWFEMLNIRANMIVKRSKEDREKIKADLKERIKQLEDDN